MASIEEQILRASKEIVVKFIETGRISPTGFPDIFKSVYSSISHTVKAHQPVYSRATDKPSKDKTSKKDK